MVLYLVMIGFGVAMFGLGAFCEALWNTRPDYDEDPPHYWKMEGARSAQSEDEGDS